MKFLLCANNMRYEHELNMGPTYCAYCMRYEHELNVGPHIVPTLEISTN